MSINGSSQILYGYDDSISKLSHVGISNNSLKVDNTSVVGELQNTLTKLSSIDTRLDNCDSSLNTIESASGFIKSRLYDAGVNLGAGELLAVGNTKLSSIDTRLDNCDSSLNSIEADTPFIKSRLYDSGTNKGAGEILNLILSQVIAMGAVPTKTILDFETDYVSIHSGTITLENHKTGQYHVVGSDATIKQFKFIQMGEMGSPTYTVVIKVYSVGGGGVLTTQSTNTYTGIAPQSILGMNAINYYTVMPTTTGLVFHFPLDYSVDCVKNSGITLNGGSLVKNPKIGFRSYSSNSREGVYTSPFDLGSYGSTYTFAWWAKVINQNPISAFMKIFSNWDTTSDVAGNIFQSGFGIEMRNKTVYNSKPYIDYRIFCHNSAGALINLTSAQDDYGGSGTTSTYFNHATGKLFGVYTHFAFVKIDASNYKFYADGVLIADILTSSVITAPASTGVQFGGSQYQWYHPQGVLCDDIRFYSTALDASEIAKFAGVSLSTASGGIVLKDLSPNEISVSKGQLVSVEVTETTAGAADTGTEKVSIQLIASA